MTKHTGVYHTMDFEVCYLLKTTSPTYFRIFTIRYDRPISTTELILMQVAVVLMGALEVLYLLCHP